MKKLTILFLVCLFTNVALISAYDHPQDGSCKHCKPHKDKRCDVCCCIDHISAASEERGGEDIINNLFNSLGNLFNIIEEIDKEGSVTLTFQEQLTKSGDSIILVKPNTFLFQCPGQYCVEFSGCLDIRGRNPVFFPLIVFIVDGEILAPTDPRFVFINTIGTSETNCFFKSAVVEVSDCTSSDNPVPFQVGFHEETNSEWISTVGWNNLHYSIKITHITDSKCKIDPLNP